MPIISDTSKLEGRLMAHFEATLILPTYNHFKTLFSVICGFTGLKTPKTILGVFKAQNQPEDPNLAIKFERKVLETPFWYQTKALH